MDDVSPINNDLRQAIRRMPSADQQALKNMVEEEVRRRGAVEAVLPKRKPALLQPAFTLEDLLRQGAQ